MLDDSFEKYMAGRNLADRTRAQRSYALKRIERAYGINLDEEFERDKLSSLLSTFSYSSGDSRAALPNPSKLDIDADKLLTHLRWYRSHLVDYLRFKGGDVRTDSEPALETDPGLVAADALVEEIVGRTFALERDMQAALRANIGQLEAGLTIIDGGVERKVPAGFIDILAQDVNGVATVIELKAETVRPEAIAQVLAYMGCIAEETGKSVRGLLVGADHHPRVVLASKAIPNLELKKYSFQFSFK